MIVAHRIQLLPNNRQQAYFSKASGIARFSWNWALAEWNRQYEARTQWLALPEGERSCDEPPYPSGQALKKQFSARIDSEWPWMRETTSYAYQRVFPELEQAWKQYFKVTRQGLSEQNKVQGKGKPRFKKKGKSKDSFYLANTCLKVDGNHVQIAKLGQVRMRDPLRFQGKIMSARVSRDVDKWFISIAVEMPDVERVHPAPHITTGADLGVTTLATLANGQKIDKPAIDKKVARLKRYQRQQARQQQAAIVAAGLDPAKPIPKGFKLAKSNRQRALERQAQRLYRKITGIRQDATHQLTAHLTKQYSLVGLEDLNVKGMTASAKGTADDPGKNVRQKAGLNRGILNASFGEIRRQLEYKAVRTGSAVVVVNRFFPSSKTCSACGCYQPEMPLEVREWDCACGTHHDRDHNAAKNIRRLAVSTRGARETDGRGPDGNGGGQPPATSRDEASTRRLGRLTPQRKTVSGSLSATPSSVDASRG